MSAAAGAAAKGKGKKKGEVMTGECQECGDLAQGKPDDDGASNASACLTYGPLLFHNRRPSGSISLRSL